MDRMTDFDKYLADAKGADDATIDLIRCELADTDDDHEFRKNVEMLIRWHDGHMEHLKAVYGLTEQKEAV